MGCEKNIQNYDKWLDGLISELEKNASKPRLLLHACCAPCSSFVLERLNEHFDITLFYYNPNISPKSEFEFRLNELERFTRDAGYAEIGIFAPVYDPDEFYSLTRGMEELREGGERCRICYRLRLEQSARYARDEGFDYFTTTLSISPYKNAKWLNEIGRELEEEWGVKYLYSDFKKKNGYKRSIEISREYGLYRQDYCGCVYSKMESANKR